jgi:KDO2-lipid IV(A) lauroyltransferase
MNIVLTAIAWFFIILMGILPFRILYFFSDFARFVLKDVFGYRKKVIVSNLKRCFPEAGPDEIKKLTHDVYVNLMDVMAEGFKAFTMSDNQISARHKILNPEILNPYKNTQTNIIAAPTHYGNWEWGALSPPLQLDYQIAAFYTPLSNPHMDMRIRRNRSRTGTILSSTHETSKTFDDQENSRTVFIMAGDQSPSKKRADRAVWVDFLGQQTAFLHGIEKHAVSRNLPVMFVDIQRVKRGYYELELSWITQNPRETSAGEITKLYAKKLEEQIRRSPGNWLWSHRRWKLNEE